MTTTSPVRLGDYTLLMRLGRGGMGTVYLAESPAGRVALKVLEGTTVESQAVTRFEQECEVLRGLEHRHLVAALGPMQRDGERFFYAMEYVEGRNVQQLLRAHGRLDPHRAVEIATQTLEGLAAAHAAGVLHRDIKGTNLLVARDGCVKICDFGLAFAVDRTRLTRTGQTLGTPAYMAPEQVRGKPPVEQTDLYAVGVVLYEMLTGRLPFESDSPLVMMRMHAETRPKPPSTHCPDLPPALDAVIQKALRKRPEKRFASADAMRTALLAALDLEDSEPDPAMLSTIIMDTLAQTPTIGIAVTADELSDPLLPSGPTNEVSGVSERTVWGVLFVLALGISFSITVGVRGLFGESSAPPAEKTQPEEVVSRTEEPRPQPTGTTRRFKTSEVSTPRKTALPTPPPAARKTPRRVVRRTPRKTRGPRKRPAKRPRKRPKKTPRKTPPKKAPKQIKIILTDGTQILGQDLRMQGELFLIKQAGGATVEIPRTLVDRVEYPK